MGLFKQDTTLSDEVGAFAGSDEQKQALQADLDAADKYNKLRYGALAVFLGLIGFIFLMS